MFLKFAEEIKFHKLCVSVAELDVSGKDIIREISDIDHRKIGEILEKLLMLVIDEKIDNEKAILLNEVHNILKTL